MAKTMHRDSSAVNFIKEKIHNYNCDEMTMPVGEASIRVKQPVRIPQVSIGVNDVKEAQRDQKPDVALKEQIAVRASALSAALKTFASRSEGPTEATLKIAMTRVKEILPEKATESPYDPKTNPLVLERLVELNEMQDHNRKLRTAFEKAMNTPMFIGPMKQIDNWAEGGVATVVVIDQDGMLRGFVQNPGTPQYLHYAISKALMSMALGDIKGDVSSPKNYRELELKFGLKHQENLFIGGIEGEQDVDERMVYFAGGSCHLSPELRKEVFGMDDVPATLGAGYAEEFAAKLTRYYYMHPAVERAAIGVTSAPLGLEYLRVGN